MYSRGFIGLVAVASFVSLVTNGCATLGNKPEEPTPADQLETHVFSFPSTDMQGEKIPRSLIRNQIQDSLVDALGKPLEDRKKSESLTYTEGVASERRGEEVDIVFKSEIENKSRGRKYYTNVIATYKFEVSRSGERVEIKLKPPEYIKTEHEKFFIEYVDPIVTHQEAQRKIKSALAGLSPDLTRVYRAKGEIDTPFSVRSVEASLDRNFEEAHDANQRFPDTGNSMTGSEYVIEGVESDTSFSVAVEPYRDGAKAMYSMASQYRITQDGEYVPDKSYFHDIEDKIQKVIKQK